MLQRAIAKWKIQESIPQEFSNWNLCCKHALIPNPNGDLVIPPPLKTFDGDTCCLVIGINETKTCNLTWGFHIN